MKSHSEIMQELKQSHNGIHDLLQGRRFHYIDIPVYDNIGDLLIMQGTMQFFKTHSLTPTTISATYYFKHEWCKPGDVIVFQGGGNFGDLYGDIHAMREKIIAAFPNNRIVLMPQTICFSGDEARKRSVALLSAHTDMHFFVRDRISLEIAREFTDHVYLVPDMAHHLYPIRYAQPAMEGNLRIQRVDTEKPEPPESVKEIPFRTTTDWVDVIGAEKKWIDVLGKLEWRLSRYGLGLIARRLLALWYWMPVAQRFSNKAIELLSRYELVVTDRLHGHILSCLMDKPNVVIDNSYGKNSTYMAEWTGQSPLVKIIRE